MGGGFYYANENHVRHIQKVSAVSEVPKRALCSFGEEIQTMCFYFNNFINIKKSNSYLFLP